MLLFKTVVLAVRAGWSLRPIKLTHNTRCEVELFAVILGRQWVATSAIFLYGLPWVKLLKSCDFSLATP